MSEYLNAEFEHRFHGGARIQASFKMRSDRFSIGVLFGPSGAGKSTVLRCIAGLNRPQQGHIQFAGEPWFDAREGIHLSPQKRDIGYCFQQGALFPHLNVANNIGYAIGYPKKDSKATLSEMLERFELTGLEKRFPHELSGGQQQRVALARALARRPRLMLLDEPLAALDSNLRIALRGRLREWLRQFDIPVLLVTHDRTDAIALADKIMVLTPAGIEQSGTIDEVFSKPRNAAVAQMVGTETILRGTVILSQQGITTVRIGATEIQAGTAENFATGQSVYACIQGENVTLLHHPVPTPSSRNQFAVKVTAVIPEGPLLRIRLDGGFELTALITKAAAEGLTIQAGQSLTAMIKATAIHLVAT